MINESLYATTVEAWNSTLPAEIYIWSKIWLFRREKMISANELLKIGM